MIEILQANLQAITGVYADKQRPKVCVEAAHIYTDEVPGFKHQLGAVIGANVCRILGGMGVDVQRMLFVDDFNAVSNDLSLSEYGEFIGEHGFTPDIVVMESTLVDDANRLIGQLEEAGLTERNRNGATVLKKNNKRDKDIVLVKSPIMGSIPACNALDAALYLRKFETAGVCVTILDKQWQDQQNSVKKVLKALGKDIPILEVYYLENGEIEVDFDY